MSKQYLTEQEAIDRLDQFFAEELRKIKTSAPDKLAPVREPDSLERITRDFPGLFGGEGKA